MFLSFSIGLILLSSCQENSISGIDDTSPDLKTLKFSYKGENYLSTYYLNQDSTYVFSNKNTEKIYQKLINNPSLSELVKEDGSIEYFDDSEEALSSLKDQSRNKSVEAYANGFGFIDMAKHGGMQGYTIRYTYDRNGISISYVGDKLNDEITSFFSKADFKHAVTIYEHDNYRGKSRTFISQKPSGFNLNIVDIRHLRSYKYGGFLNTKTWNDRLTSFKVSPTF